MLVLTFINVKKNFLFETWRNDNKPNIENSTDHFCEYTRQNALAALTNIGHVKENTAYAKGAHCTVHTSEG